RVCRVQHQPGTQVVPIPSHLCRVCRMCRVCTPEPFFFTSFFFSLSKTQHTQHTQHNLDSIGTSCVPGFAPTWHTWHKIISLGFSRIIAWVGATKRRAPKIIPADYFRDIPAT